MSVLSVSKSIPLVTLCHAMVLPARYAVGKWNNIPLSTIAVYNAADLGVHVIINHTFQNICKNKKWKMEEHHRIAAAFFIRVISCIAGIYAASFLKAPMPIRTAVSTHLAGWSAIVVSLSIAEPIYKKWS